MNLILLSLWFGGLAFAQDAPSDAPADAPADGAADAVAPDRSKRPEVLPPVALELPDFETHVLTDAVTVKLVPVPGVRKVQLRAFFHRGSLDLDEWPTPATWATGWLQDVATDTHDANELELIGDLHDISVWSSGIGLRRARLTLEVPREDLERGLDVFAEVLHEPAYPGSEVKRYVRETMRWYEYEAPTSASSVADALLGFAWYPKDHPYGSRPDVDAVAGLKRKHLALRHERILAESPITVLVVGDVDWKGIESPLRAVFEDLGTAGSQNEQPEFTPPTADRIVASDMPGVDQTTLYLRMAAPPLDHEDRLGMGAVAWALGGHFLSRLNKVLREEKGYTYGSHAWYSPDFTRGTWTVSVEVATENTAAAIGEIERVIGEVVALGVTAEEIESSRLEKIQSWNTVRQTAETAFGFYTSLLDNQEELADVRARHEALTTLTVEQTQQVASRWLSEDQPRTWVIVGDREAIEPQLSDRDWAIEWVTPQQAVLGEL